MQLCRYLTIFVFASAAMSAQAADEGTPLRGAKLESARQLQSGLAGTWAWTPEACDVEPIRISSSADWHSLHHDIGPEPAPGAELPVSQRSVYRLALEGETRKDSAGTPIIWELVMQSPHRFCWRQTDWPDGGCTESLTRCPP